MSSYSPLSMRPFLLLQTCLGKRVEKENAREGEGRERDRSDGLSLMKKAWFCTHWTSLDEEAALGVTGSGAGNVGERRI